MSLRSKHCKDSIGLRVFERGWAMLEYALLFEEVAAMLDSEPDREIAAFHVDVYLPWLTRNAEAIAQAREVRRLLDCGTRVPAVTLMEVGARAGNAANDLSINA